MGSLVSKVYTWMASINGEEITPVKSDVKDRLIKVLQDVEETLRVSHKERLTYFIHAERDRKRLKQEAVAMKEEVAYLKGIYNSTGAKECHQNEEDRGDGTGGRQEEEADNESEGYPEEVRGKNGDNMDKTAPDKDATVQLDNAEVFDDQECSLTNDASKCEEHAKDGDGQEQVIEESDLGEEQSEASALMKELSVNQVHGDNPFDMLQLIPILEKIYSVYLEDLKTLKHVQHSLLANSFQIILIYEDIYDAKKKLMEENTNVTDISLILMSHILHILEGMMLIQKDIELGNTLLLPSRYTDEDSLSISDYDSDSDSDSDFSCGFVCDLNSDSDSCTYSNFSNDSNPENDPYLKSTIFKQLLHESKIIAVDVIRLKMLSSLSLYQELIQILPIHLPIRKRTCKCTAF